MASGSAARAAFASFGVWDGVCPNEPAACGAPAIQLHPDAAGIYTIRTIDRRVTIDIFVTNPRVVDRYLELTARFSWDPNVSSGANRTAEFDILHGKQDQIRWQLPFDTWPTEGRATFTLTEAGPDIPGTNRIVVEVPFTAIVDPARPGPELRVGSCALSDYRSLEALVPASIRFTNTAPTGRRLFWMNYAGQRVLFNTLAPLASVTQPTFMSHWWLVADESDNCTGFYRPEYGSSVVTIR